MQSILIGLSSLLSCATLTQADDTDYTVGSTEDLGNEAQATCHTAVFSWTTDMRRYHPVSSLCREGAEVSVVSSEAELAGSRKNRDY